MEADRIEYTIYVVQGWLNPGIQARWCDIAPWAVPGYKRWHEHPDRVGYLGERFYM